MEPLSQNTNSDANASVQDLQPEIDPTTSNVVQHNKLASGVLFGVSNTRHQANERMQIRMLIVGFLLILIGPIVLMLAGQHGINVLYFGDLILITVSDFDVDTYMSTRPRLCLIGPFFNIWFCLAVLLSRYDMTADKYHVSITRVARSDFQFRCL